RQRASLFGYNAPDWQAMAKDVRDRYLALGRDPGDGTDWPGMKIQEIAAPPPAPGTGTGLSGEYFNSTNLPNSVNPRIDETVNFDWSGVAPIAGLGTEQYSVRWRGFVRAADSGTYQFQTHSDDGVRLWVNNQRIIDNWTAHSATDDTGSITLNGGTKYELTLEYFQAGGDPTIPPLWMPPREGAFLGVPTAPLS